MRNIRGALALAALVTIASHPVRAGEEQIVAKQGPGRDLAVGRCMVCHSFDYVPMNAPVLDRAGWEKVVHKMIDRYGAPVSEEEAKAIVAYLEKNYSTTTVSR